MHGSYGRRQTADLNIYARRLQESLTVRFLESRPIHSAGHHPTVVTDSFLAAAGRQAVGTHAQLLDATGRAESQGEARVLPAWIDRASPSEDSVAVPAQVGASSIARAAPADGLGVYRLSWLNFGRKDRRYCRCTGRFCTLKALITLAFRGNLGPRC